MATPERLRVVGGADERRGAEELADAFRRFHGAIHDVKQLEQQVSDRFAELEEAASTLRAHNVNVSAEFGGAMQAALSHWRARRPKPERSPQEIAAGPRFLLEDDHAR